MLKNKLVITFVWLLNLGCTCIGNMGSIKESFDAADNVYVGTLINLDTISLITNVYFNDTIESEYLRYEFAKKEIIKGAEFEDRIWVFSEHTTCAAFFELKGDYVVFSYNQSIELLEDSVFSFVETSYCMQNRELTAQVKSELDSLSR